MKNKSVVTTLLLLLVVFVLFTTLPAQVTQVPAASSGGGGLATAGNNGELQMKSGSSLAATTQLTATVSAGATDLINLDGTYQLTATGVTTKITLDNDTLKCGEGEGGQRGICEIRFYRVTNNARFMDLNTDGVFWGDSTNGGGALPGIGRISDSRIGTRSLTSSTSLDFQAANYYGNIATGTTTFESDLPVLGGGSGSVLKTGTKSGNTNVVVTTAGSQTGQDCVKIDDDGNHVASGSACASALPDSTFYQNQDNRNGDWYLGGANDVRILDYVVTTPVTFGNMMFRVSTADGSPCSGGSNCYDVGLYSTAGVRLAHIGATSFTSTGVVDTTISGGGTISLSPGRYFMAFTGSAGNATLSISSDGTNFMGRSNASVATSTGGVLPATITPGSDSWVLGQPPFMAIRQ